MLNYVAYVVGLERLVIVLYYISEPPRPMMFNFWSTQDHCKCPLLYSVHVFVPNIMNSTLIITIMIIKQ